MPVSRRFALLFISIFATLASAQSLPVEVAQELKNWGNRSGGAQVVVNPALGHLDINVVDTQNEILQIARELGGEALKRAAPNLVVTLLSAEDFGGFVAKYEPVKGSAWEQWNENHPDQLWPIITLNRLDPMGENVLELVVNVGVTNQVKERDVLAALIAHELVHILQKHLKTGEKAADFIAQAKKLQAFEVQADLLAMDLLLGKYEISAILKTLDFVYTEQQQQQSNSLTQDANQAVKNYLATHHHEGVRYAAIIAYLQYLRGTSKAAQRRPPIPRSIKYIRPLLERRGHRDLPDSVLQEYLNYLKKFWLTRSQQVSYSHEGFRAIKDEDRPRYYLSNYQSRTVLLNFIKLLENSSLPNHRKMRALSLVLITTGSSALWKDDIEIRIPLQNLLLKLVQGPTAYNVDEFVKDGLRSHSSNWESVPYALFTYALERPIMTKMFEQLVQVSPWWRRFFELNTQSSEQAAMGTFHPQYAISRYFDLLVNILPADKQNKRPFFDANNNLKANPTLRNMFVDGVVAYMTSEKFVEDVEKQRREDVPQYFHTFRAARKLTQEFSTAIPPQVLSQIQRVSAGFQDARHDYLVRLESSHEEFNKDYYFFIRETLQSHLEFPLTPDEVRIAHDLIRKRAIDSAQKEFSITQAQSFWMSDPPSTFVRFCLDNILEAQVGSAEWIYQVAFLAPILGRGADLREQDVQNYLPRIEQQLLTLSGDDLERIMKTKFAPLDRFVEGAMKDPALVAAIANLKRLNEIPKNKRDENWEVEQDQAHSIVFSKGWMAQRAIEIRISQRNGMLGYFVSTEKARKHFIETTSYSSIDSLLKGLESDYRLFDRWRKLEFSINAVSLQSIELRPSPKTGLLLIGALLKTEAQAPSAAEWRSKVERILALNEYSLELDNSLKTELGARVYQHLRNAPREEVIRELRKNNLVRYLGMKERSEIVDRVIDIPTGASRADEAKLIRKFLSSIRWKADGEFYNYYRKHLAEARNLQPGETKAFVPQQTQDLITMSNQGALGIRGLSALVAVTRGHTPAEQIEMIDYLMGRQINEPEFIRKLGLAGESYYPLLATLQSVRRRLQTETHAARAVVVASFLSGPSSFIRDSAGYDIIVEHILKNITPGRATMAKEISRALFQSHEEGEPLAIAYVLAVPATKNGTSEGDLLRSVFEAYGVAGVKLGQYLAFTADLAEFQESLGKLQDQAMPLSFLEAVQLIEKTTGMSWPAGSRVVSVIGSGSVNVIVEYEYFENGQKKSGVVSLPRESVEVAIENDFTRLQKAIEFLISKNGREKYEFMLGLLKIAKRSVSLELDRQHAIERQKQAMKIYTTREFKNGWKISVPKILKIVNGAIFMEKANGITARKLFETNRALYNELMEEYIDVEIDQLFGMGEAKVIVPRGGLANADFHDGQMVVDVVNRTVHLLDFGQALDINNTQRDLGVTLLRISMGIETIEGGSKILADLLTKTSGKTISAEMVERALTPVFGVQWPRGGFWQSAFLLLKGGDRDRVMQRFIEVAANFENLGVEIPLESLHWILGVNRQVKLGARIGKPIDGVIRNLLISHKMGIGQTGANIFRASYQCLKTLTNKK